MTRLSQRVSEAWTTVKCPRCGTRVDPRKLVFEDTSPTPVGAGGKRWSFIWTAPRGDFCPECEFPMSKYFGRLKWIRTSAVGVAIVLVSVTLQMIGNMGRFGDGFYEITKNAIRIGAAVAVVGIIGIVVGGRRGIVRAVDRM